MLIGQFGANVAPHCHWLVDAESESVELCNLEDCEPEEEKDSKIKIDLFTPQYGSSVLLVNITHSEDLRCIHHLEVMTPPPQHFFS